MIIQCSQCGTQYQINPALQGVALKSGNCMVCGAILPPPTAVAPAAAGAQHKRRHEREKLHIRSFLLMNASRQEIHGVTLDLSASGAYLQTLNNPADEKIKLGDVGIFEMVLHESAPPTTCEFLCEVARITDEGVGIRFLLDDECNLDALAAANSPLLTPRPRSVVYVRRSNGCLEGEWEVAPATAKFPPAIVRVLRERKNIALCVVCRKRLTEGDSYKIYTVKELREIQAEAEQQKRAISRIMQVTGEDAMNQTRRF